VRIGRNRTKCSIVLSDRQIRQSSSANSAAAILCKFLCPRITQLSVPLIMSVLLETSLGDIVIDLEIDACPKTCENFLKLCKVYYYNLNAFFNGKL